MLSVARGGLIERRGVGAQISAALRSGSVLLIAGAGYGKTTALRQVLGHDAGARRGLDVATPVVTPAGSWP